MPVAKLGGGSNAMSFRCAAGVAVYESEVRARVSAFRLLVTFRQRR